MTAKPSRRKPRGQTGPIRFGPQGITRELVYFPITKDEIEIQIAQAFCNGNSGMKDQVTRYIEFKELSQHKENSIDFSVQTTYGHRWLELAEFAPLEEFSGNYDNVPFVWGAEMMIACLLKLIMGKNAKQYGTGVILVIYKTHERCFVPPPVLQLLRSRLLELPAPLSHLVTVKAYG
jgi:hypothetical protein